MARQPEALTCVRALPDGPILGYSITYWFTGAALERVLAGAIRSGADLQPEDLSLPSVSAAAC